MDQPKWDKAKKRVQTGRWTHAQCERFLKGLEKYGKDWVKVQKVVKTRTLTQVRSHAQKVFMKMDPKDLSMYVASDSESEIDFSANKIPETHYLQVEPYKEVISSPTNKTLQEKISTPPQQKTSFSIQMSPFQKIPQVGSQASIFTQLLLYHRQHFLQGGTFMDLTADPQTKGFTPYKSY